MLIGVITYASNEDEAFRKANNVIEELIERDHFDYAIPFDDEFAISRWGKLPTVCRADSPEGKKLIERLMDATWKDFKSAISEIRSLLENFSDEEIFELEPNELKKISAGLTNDDKMFRGLHLNQFLFHELSRYGCSHSVYLFDNDGFEITNRTYLEKVLSRFSRVLEKTNMNDIYEGLDVFITPFNAHY